jgi:hypothetical protein
MFSEIYGSGLCFNLEVVACRCLECCVVGEEDLFLECVLQCMRVSKSVKRPGQNRADF